MCDLGVDWIGLGLKLKEEVGGKFTFDLEQCLAGLLNELLAQHKRESETASFTMNTSLHCATTRQDEAEELQSLCLNLLSRREQASTHDHRNGSAGSDRGVHQARPGSSAHQCIWRPTREQGVKGHVKKQ